MYWFKRLLFLLRKKLLFKEINAHLKHSKVIKHQKILPLASIEEVCPHNSHQLINSSFEDGDISDIELDYISRIVKHYNPKNIFEIGTFNGRTTLNLAANTSDDTKIYTVDIPEKDLSKTILRIKSGEKRYIKKQKSGIYFIGTDYENRITQIYSDSASLNYQPYIDKMDFVFIDGSHSYEYVVNDTLNALKLLKNGKGIIMWHDYGWNEVVQALNEFYLDNKDFSNLKQIQETSFAYIRFE